MCLKLFFASGVLVFAILACSLQPGTSTPSEVAATDTPVASITDTPVPTPTELPIPPALAPATSPALAHINFQDANNGWGVATNDSGYILRTVDGGATWLNATPPGIDSVGYSTGLFALNVNTVWVLAPGADFFTGTLYRTTDGGISWTSNPVPFGGDTLQFLDASTGRAMADRGAGAGSQAVEMYQTSDGGATWVSVFHNDPTQPGSSDSLPLGGIKNGMTFLDANTGWVTGSRPMGGDVYLFVTHDGGVSWTQQPIPLPAGYETNWYTPSAPVFFGQDGFLPLIISFPAGNIEQTFYVTHDGGATWSGDPTNANKVVVPGRYAFADALHAWAWDGGGNLYFTTDGAQTWGGMAASLDLSGRLSELDFVPSTTEWFTGWALTSVDDSGHSQLYRTADNGATWTSLIP
jgi:photosystem II stability/assembly factor-like uncharacterized protein